jgi:hypothetical protein
MDKEKPGENSVDLLVDQSKQKKRGYSDFFAWPVDRQLEEWAIVDSLKESLEKANAGFFNWLHEVGAMIRRIAKPTCLRAANWA